MAYQIRLRRNVPRGIAPALAEPVLDGSLFKIGDGATPIEHLPAIGTLGDIPDATRVHTQTMAVREWVIPNPFDRPAAVTVYVEGVEVDADTMLSGTNIIITFPTPAVGVAVLN